MGRVPYTKKDQEFMLENAQILSLQEIADKLGRTELSVRSYFNKRKIPTRKNTYTKAEIDFITENAGKYSWEHIAKELGKSPAGMRTFASRLKIKGSYAPENKSHHADNVKCQGLLCCNYFRVQRKQKKFCSTACDKSFSNVKRYGISPRQWQEMYLKQENKCVCGAIFNIAKELPHIDHDHACCGYGRSCGKCVRSLLCKYCNWTIGYVKESPKTLELLADYLRRCRNN